MLFPTAITVFASIPADGFQHVSLLPPIHLPCFLSFWCSGWTQHPAQLPFLPVPWLSLPPASTSDRLPASQRALGQAPARLFLCPHAPVPSSSPCSTRLTLSAGGERWCETILRSSQGHLPHRQLLQPFCQLPGAHSKPPCSEKTNTTNPKLTRQMFCTKPNVIYLLLNRTYSKHFQQLNQNNYSG